MMHEKETLTDCTCPVVSMLDYVPLLLPDLSLYHMRDLIDHANE